MDTEAVVEKKVVAEGAVRTVKVTFLPMQITVEAQEGQNILDVALDHQIPLEHNCGGNCACSTCHVIVRSGTENLSPMQDNESDQLDEAEGLTLSSRLGCQCILHGDVIVEIPRDTQTWRKAEEH